MKIGNNIKKYRNYRQMTQEELAKRLSKSKSVISHWENGENSPDLDTCEQICRVLEITPNVLFGWESFKEYDDFLKRMEVYRTEILKLQSKKADIDNQIAKLNDRMKGNE
jgi:transcriptional regulator with XRE-family HTH domain